MATNADIESSKLPSQGHTPTGIGIIINAAIQCKQSVTIPANTTLNELRGIMATQATGKKNGRDFELGWFGIGLKGSKSIGENADGIEVRRLYRHTAADFNAFKPIPFLMRELANDIDDEERKKYGLREVRKIGSKTYVLYWVRAIGFTLFDPTMKTGYRDPVTGNNEEDTFTPKESNLSPVPEELLTTDSVPASDQFMIGYGLLDLSLEAAELDEIRNVCTILYGTPSIAALSETYLVYGIPTRTTGASANGGTVAYTELCPACVAYTVTELYGRDANTNSRLKTYYKYGNAVPYITQTVSTEGLSVIETS